jgi:hypothetical protein
MNCFIRDCDKGHSLWPLALIMPLGCKTKIWTP